MTTEKEQYRKKWEAKLDEWSAEIDRLEAKARKHEAQTRSTYLAQVDYMRQKRQEMKNKLDELRASGNDAWGDLKTGIEIARDSLSEALKSASERF